MSIRGLVRRSVRLSVGWLVGNAFVKIDEEWTLNDLDSTGRGRNRDTEEGGTRRKEGQGGTRRKERRYEKATRRMKK